MRKAKYLFALLLTLLLALSASAAEAGSLTITGIEDPVCLHYVADADAALAEAFADAPVENLSEDTAAAANAAILYDYALENSIPGTQLAPDANGVLLFEVLSEGLYLLYSPSGEFTPFLVNIPTVLNGETVYHIHAEPKPGEPTEPAVPTEPTEPDPEIPQTGRSVWPKYILMVIGAAAVLIGIIDLIRGREKV